MEAAYSNPPEAKSENLAPPSNIVLIPERSIRRLISTSQLHLDLHALYQAGLLAMHRDEDGTERFTPIAGESL